MNTELTQLAEAETRNAHPHEWGPRKLGWTAGALRGFCADSEVALAPPLGPLSNQHHCGDKDSHQGLGLELCGGHGTHVVQAREPAQWPRATPVLAGGAVPQEEAMTSGVYRRQSPTNGGVKPVMSRMPLVNILMQLEDYTPMTLGAVAGSSLNHAGFEASGPCITQRIPWLQKFIPDIASDAQ
ncbi:hypothetical protein MC885_018036 [Smutsia gigantea]|nr:hypothetical protein MC885_018036 [Smutsia gigantea]